MKERPILFSGPMIRALLDDRKTQTRRVVKPPPKWAERYPICNPSGMAAGHQVWWWDGQYERVGVAQDCPYGAPGDRLWVREALECANGEALGYPADGTWLPNTEWQWQRKKIPSIHMPRWASRILLEITDVRVERLTGISEADAIAEGLYKSFPDADDNKWFHDWTMEETGLPPTSAEIDYFNKGVWRAPGVRVGWGINKAARDQDQWAPSAGFAYRLLWESINGPGSWDVNPWVWVVAFKRVDAD